MNYATTQEVFDFMQLTLEVPDYDNQVTTKETIGVADGTTSTTYFLDHARIIDGSEVISYGPSYTILTNPTHYTLNNDRGSFVLTGAGNTAVGTATLYGEYKYTSNWKDSVVEDIITSKTKLLVDILNKDFTGLNVVVQEEQPGKGPYDRIYKVDGDKYPISVFKGQLNGAVGSTATTFILDSTSGLNVGDYCSIEEEVVKVTTISSSTQIIVSRGELGTSGAVHSDNIPITNTVVEISNSPVGGIPTWVVLEYKSQFDVDSETGAVQLMHVNAGDRNYVTSDVYPLHRVFDRFRRTYTYGASSVPDDVKQLCILMTAKEMFNAQVLNALSRGTNGFTSDSIKLVDDSINKLIAKNKRLAINGN